MKLGMTTEGRSRPDLATSPARKSLNPLLAFAYRCAAAPRPPRCFWSLTSWPPAPAPAERGWVLPERSGVS